MVSVIAATGAPVGHPLLVFPEPLFFGEGYLSDERARLRDTVARLQAESKKEAIRARRQKLCDRAANGAKDAFRFVRGDDDPDRSGSGPGLAGQSGVPGWPVAVR